MEQKLTKEQTNIILFLNDEIERAVKNLKQAEINMEAQIELLRKFYDLPEGKAQFRAEGQEVVLVIEESEREKK